MPGQKYYNNYMEFEIAMKQGQKEKNQEYCNKLDEIVNKNFKP